MSYCRFLEGDVYAYDSCEGGVRFYVSGGRRNLDRLCRTYNEAYQYAKALRDEHGLSVPKHAIQALMEDAIEETEHISGSHGVVADLLAENAKLRELLEEALEYINHPFEASWTHQARKKARDSLNDRMRELGVEVDG